LSKFRLGTQPTSRAADFLEVLGCVIPPNSAVYCSAPITSGEKFAEWVRKSGHRVVNLDEANELERTSYRREVIEPNGRHASQVVARLRSQLGVAVIDPSAVSNVEGWLQTDWIRFWVEVIHRFANRVVFVDGWQFSNGCAQEYLAAIESNVPTYDERMMLIPVGAAVELLRRAITQLGAGGVTVSKLEDIADVLATKSP
jgi:hypothetical protein